MENCNGYSSNDNRLRGPRDGRGRPLYVCALPDGAASEAPSQSFASLRASVEAASILSTGWPDLQIDSVADTALYGLPEDSTSHSTLRKKGGAMPALFLLEQEFGHIEKMIHRLTELAATEQMERSTVVVNAEYWRRRIG